ncbi:TRAP transporter small permease subunit [Sulfitobacter sp. EhC04]|uniref:TRAP transporter small permease subunit n=1 Tax=Sulfitobacter sp. EhC04 TaxID=1849168 RepID=UPI00228728EC|nr:TRAP transporter small permease [Sulfitobacter sp. EhC04]
MLHVLSDVIMKTFFNSPIPGTSEFVAHYYMVAAVFLPMPFVEMRNSGIAVDLFYNLFGPAIQRIMLLCAYLGQLTFFSLLAYQSGLDAWHAWEVREYLSGQIIVTIWPASFFLPVGFGLSALASALRFVQVIHRPDWVTVTEYKSAEEVDRRVKDIG